MAAGTSTTADTAAARFQFPASPKAADARRKAALMPKPKARAKRKGKV